MKFTRICSLLLGLSLILTCFSSVAQPVEFKKNEQGIEYMNGGVGLDEAEFMSNYIYVYSLRLLFSEGTRGRSIAGVNVSIYDSHQNLVFQLDDAQPQLLVNLPKGNYYVQADYYGVKQGYRFKLKEKEHKKIVLNWKNHIEEDSVENGNGNGEKEEPLPQAR